MTEQQIDQPMTNHDRMNYWWRRATQADAELDSWMARAYEAEGKLWKAEARVKAVEDVLDAEEARPRPIGGGYDKRAMVRIADIRRALESDPPPGQ